MLDSPPPSADTSLQSASVLQDFFDNAPIGIYTSTPDGRLLAANPAMARLVGYENPEELIESITDIATQIYAEPQDRVSLFQLLDEHGEIGNHEIRFRRKDGSVFWVSLNMKSVRDNHGKITCFHGFVTVNACREKNVGARQNPFERLQKCTLQSQYELKLQESEERYRTLFERTASPIMVIDEKGNYIEANDSALSFLECSREELLKKNVTDFMSPSRDKILGQLLPLWKSGGVFEREYIVNGMAKTLILTITPGTWLGQPVVFGNGWDITDRKQAERLLRENERVLRQEVEQRRQAEAYLNNILNTIPDPVFVKDIHHRWVKLNTPFCEFMGRTAEELLGKSDYDYFPREEADVFWEKDKMVLETGEDNINEEFFTDFNGVRHVISTRKSRLILPDTGEKLLVGVIRDITEKKCAEEILQDEVVRRRILIDQSRDGIVVLHENGSVHEANKRFSDMLGYTSNEVQHLYIWDWQPHYSRDYLLEILRNADTEGDPIETQHRRKDGTFHDVEISCNGAVIGGKKLVFCVCRDITQRKQAEYGNAKTREILLQAEILAKMGSLEWDIVNDIWYVSKNWLCIMGHDSPQLSSPELFAYVHPEDRFRVKRAIAKTMKTAKSYNIEHRILRGGSGEVCYIQSYAVVEFNKSGKPVRSFGTIQDISERKKNEEKIKAINEQLQLANNEKDKLFAIIAHDLRSPMSGLVTSTELLVTQPDIFSEKDVCFLAMELHKNAKNSFELLEDLLQWARMTQGGISFAPTSCSLNELISMGLSTARDLARYKEISLLLDIAPGLIVLIDQPMIKTVIRNLVFNAIKFTPHGGEIVISARQDGQDVTMAIQDNGIGMNEQVLSSIFSIVKDKCQLGTEGEKGTGLGLILCKQFIDQHGGKIWVESEPGKGTTVFFTLPRLSSLNDLSRRALPPLIIF